MNANLHHRRTAELQKYDRRRVLVTSIALLFSLALVVFFNGQQAATSATILQNGTVVTALVEGTPSVAKTTRIAADSIWRNKVSSIAWVAYAPTNADPEKGIEASRESMIEDLTALRRAGFTGLVTYGSSGFFGRELPTLAELQGFTGLIVGIWDPLGETEIAIASAASRRPIVLGICVGNEGLNKRYRMADLTAVIKSLRETSGKPVTTTEEIDDYTDEGLLTIGDWVFPNAHPFFHNKVAAAAAIRWTKAAYDDFLRRTDKFVLFKEVGLPTAGDKSNELSEADQKEYYQGLAETDVHYVCFEGFDQPWKNDLPIEPHWGLFNSDRTPKLLAAWLIAKNTPSSSERSFSVYRDADSPDNHYKPTGYMGDIGDIHINEAFTGCSHSGSTCIKIVYDAKGRAPNKCPYSPPCKWAGIYWQEPPNNWGRDEVWKDRGFDLTAYNRLVFWAKADTVCTIEFRVAGIDEPYGDSQSYARSKHATLGKDWREFEINLEGADLRRIIGGFAWVSNWDTNSNGITFYVDDIRFVRR